MNNGPARELDQSDMIEEAVYCVDCGTIYVWCRHRECPACYLAEQVEADDE